MIVRNRFFDTFLLIASAAAFVSLSIPARAAHVLITEEEAKLPPPRGAVAAWAVWISKTGARRDDRYESPALPGFFSGKIDALGNH
jgi:hypothetical protein